MKVVPSVELGLPNGQLSLQREHNMSLEMQELVQALKEQTLAINNLVEANTKMMSFIVDTMAEETLHQDDEFQFDLSGHVIR